MEPYVRTASSRLLRVMIIPPPIGIVFEAPPFVGWGPNATTSRTGAAAKKALAAARTQGPVLSWTDAPADLRQLERKISRSRAPPPGASTWPLPRVRRYIHAPVLDLERLAGPGRAGVPRG